MQAADGRPIYLNLLRIRLPMAGFISILHRVFGVLLSFSIPWFVYLFGLSLSSEAGYLAAQNWLATAWLAPLYWGLIWGLCHHLVAGIRYLLIDIEIGVERPAAMFSAKLVMGGGIVLALLVIAGLWL